MGFCLSISIFKSNSNLAIISYRPDFDILVYAENQQVNFIKSKLKIQKQKKLSLKTAQIKDIFTMADFSP